MYASKFVIPLFLFLIHRPLFPKEIDIPQTSTFFQGGRATHQDGNTCTNPCERMRRTTDKIVVECHERCPTNSQNLGLIASLPARHLVPITVTSSPSEAMIFVDDAFQGTTPSTFQLSPGNVSLEIKRLGYQTQQDERTVVTSTPVHIHYSLRKLPRYGRIQLVNIPRNVFLTLNNKKLRGAEFLEIPLVEGQHVLGLSRVGTSQRHTLTISIKHNFVTTIDVRAQATLFYEPHISKVTRYTIVSSTALSIIAGGIGLGLMLARQDTLQHLEATKRPTMRASLNQKVAHQETTATIAFSAAGAFGVIALTSWLWPQLRKNDEPAP